MDADEKKKQQESCPHPRFQQERSTYGMGTGDYYCVVCGIDRDMVKEKLKCNRCGEPITDFGKALQVTESGVPKGYRHFACLQAG